MAKTQSSSNVLFVALILPVAEPITRTRSPCATYSGGPGYARSQRIRKRIEEAFGWIKTVAGQERTKFRGRERVAWGFTFAATAYNLVRLPKLLEAA